MKTKKLLSLILAISTIFALLTACGGEQKAAKSSINPELISAFGEEMIESEEETIGDLVGGLEDCYKQYQKDNDLNAFVMAVDNAMTGYKGYLEEISDEIMNLYEEEANQDKKMELLSLYNSSIAYIADESSWSMYKMCLDNDMEIWQTEQEVENALINYIDDISEFFYCESITD